MVAGKLVARVQLNSAGGRLVEGAKLAATIRLAKISTFVGSGAVCASACFLAFAAGDPKSAVPGALGREDSNLRMVESKSGRTFNEINAHSEKSVEFGSICINRLADDSECWRRC
jgi:hypothetical protein